MNFTIRTARIEDLELIQTLINRSTRELQRGFYEESEIDAALELIGGLDVLIQSGQYFVAENDGCIAGCGGVSLLLDEETSAEIRGFFVAPEYARKGVASSVFDYCEKYCSERGVKSLFLASTLSGEPFYSKRGFTEIGRVKEPLSNGQFFELINMEKRL
ncbi:MULTISPECIES: GNAT family N-acetyltransferase [Marinomonas]|uniref:N-acetylglutamate synthase-like GNAT family acetyltransferase n=1 Tax=Marinomonas alcarazii TaxID=491949 RepID=A0A318UZI8_9GAMM|nr:MULTISPECIES: GNAT family N-acetyltransferase [Marinomonas]PYF80987.1 N-acetylglutamate synthase-like GNAT family acetyltransferase [Marinomonas alcarazii]